MELASKDQILEYVQILKIFGHDEYRDGKCQHRNGSSFIKDQTQSPEIKRKLSEMKNSVDKFKGRLGKDNKLSITLNLDQ